MDLKNISTKQLVDELKTREAVQYIPIEPYEKIELRDIQIDEGPAIIFVIWD